MKQWQSWGLALATGVLLASLVGCGNSGLVDVKGQVSYDGKPIDEGAISFEPADGKGPASGGEIKGGKYELRGKAAVTPGSKIVRIRGNQKTGRKVGAFPGSPATVDEVKSVVPPEYNEKSTLKAEVTSGKENEHNFDLKRR